MNSKQSIIDYASKYISITNEEAIQLSSCFTEIKVKKRQCIVQPGFVAKHRNFVLKGAFRAYVIGDDGNEHTIQFAIEEWWISDYNSYIFQLPATMFVVALEDSTILQIDYKSELKLKKENHKFETFFRILAERATAFMLRRIVTNLTKSAEERYDEFTNCYPLIVNRVPQQTLASFLGFSKEFLSRIRRRKTQRS